MTKKTLTHQAVIDLQKGFVLSNELHAQGVKHIILSLDNGRTIRQHWFKGECLRVDRL